MNDPVWQPAGGMVDGAVELDGTDDYMVAPLVLDPGSGPFSVFVWIKGGAAGQVVLSPANGRIWLSAKPETGVLMTQLIPGMTARSLSSDAVITDGEWHCVGLSWDGMSELVMYTDGVEVARNTQSGIPGSSGSLYIGAGKNMEPGTFWSGLVDDVRIYSRVLSPEQIRIMTN